MRTIQQIKKLTDRISISLLGVEFIIRIESDNEFKNGRLFIQIIYCTECNKTGEFKEWHGRKWYLSKYMTDDEIIKTAYCAFEATIKHEMMEGFKVDGKVLFNPHINFEALLSISDQEVCRA